VLRPSAQGLVSLFKDNAVVAAIAAHSYKNNISVFEGSGGNWFLRAFDATLDQREN
jgi:hypothetical protein